MQPDRLDDLRQQLPGAADERDPLHVLVGARRFADEHQIGGRVADAEHDLLAAQPMQLAARAVADLVADRCSASVGRSRASVMARSRRVGGDRRGRLRFCGCRAMQRRLERCRQRCRTVSRRRQRGSGLTPVTPSS